MDEVTYNINKQVSYKYDTLESRIRRFSTIPAYNYIARNVYDRDIMCEPINTQVMDYLYVGVLSRLYEISKSATSKFINIVFRKLVADCHGIEYRDPEIYMHLHNQPDRLLTFEFIQTIPTIAALSALFSASLYSSSDYVTSTDQYIMHKIIETPGWVRSLRDYVMSFRFPPQITPSIGTADIYATCSIIEGRTLINTKCTRQDANRASNRLLLLCSALFVCNISHAGTINLLTGKLTTLAIPASTPAYRSKLIELI